MNNDDLAFHADIIGASLVILKDGMNASDMEKRETAQFSASMSKAWKEGYASVDVYAVPKDQISKSAPSGTYIKKGSFIISGERIWFKSVELKLVIGVIKEDNSQIPIIRPYIRGFDDISKPLVLKPGGKFKKGDAAKRIAKHLGVDVDDVLPILPNGMVGISKPK